jgi:hypothetical protein
LLDFKTLQGAYEGRVLAAFDFEPRRRCFAASPPRLRDFCRDGFVAGRDCTNIGQ